MQTKFERTNLNLEKLLICTLLIALAFSAMTTSIAFARESAPAQAPSDNTAAATKENPTLIVTQNNGTNLLNDTPTLTRTQDNSTSKPDDNSTLYSTKDTQTENNPLLIAPQSQPDNTMAILEILAIVAAITVAAIVVVLRRRKKTSA